MNAIKIGTIVVKLLPVITDTIRRIEELDSSPGKGSQKLDLALNIIRGIYETTDANPEVSFDDLVATIKKVITALVTFYNSIGVFVKNLKQDAA